MTELAGGVCVVTGAGAGLGRGLVDAFAAQDMRVVLADVSAARLREAADELTARGVECMTELVDVRDADAVDALADATVERFGGVNVICNNAGVSVMGKQWEISRSDWEWVLGVCLDGVVNGVRSFVPRILATREATGRDGHVVNIASMGGLLSSGYMGPYAAAKHAVVGLSKGLRVELDDRNESLNYRIRDAQVHKVPYMLIIGKQEVADRSVAVRARAGGRNQVMPLDEVKRRMIEERDSRSPVPQVVQVAETPAT